VVDKTVHFENAVAKILAIPQNTFLEFLHLLLLVQTIFSALYNCKTKPARGE
jgi:hypothetical protein